MSVTFICVCAARTRPGRHQLEVDLSSVRLREAQQQDGRVAECRQGDAHDKHNEADGAAAQTELALVAADLDPRLAHIVAVLLAQTERLARTDHNAPRAIVCRRHRGHLKEFEKRARSGARTRWKMAFDDTSFYRHRISSSSVARNARRQRADNVGGRAHVDGQEG